MFEKLEGMKGGPGGCLHCGGSYDHLPIEEGYVMAVGFGNVTLTKNGAVIWEEMHTPEDKLISTAEAERIAALDPDHDWRIHFMSPLYDAKYQRQGDSLWVLYEKGLGFA